VDPLHTVVQDSQNGVVLTVHVQPKASSTEYVGLHGNAMKIRVAAPPIDGAANDELVRFLAECCAVPPGSISIHAGSKSRAKRVIIRGVTSKTVLARLVTLKRRGGSKA
jgi:uncharacterized protein (TIGR00251 family)